MFAVLSYLHIPLGFRPCDFNFEDWYKFRRIIKRFVVPYFEEADKIEEKLPIMYVAQHFKQVRNEERRQRIKHSRKHRRKRKRKRCGKPKFKKFKKLSMGRKVSDIEQIKKDLHHITERYQILMNSSMLIMDWDLFNQCFTKWKRLSDQYGYNESKFQSAIVTKDIARNAKIYGKKASDLDVLHEFFSINTYLISKRKFTKQLQTKSLNQFLMKTFDVNCRKQNNDKYYNGWKNMVLMKECNVCCKKTDKLRKCKNCRQHAFYCSIKCQKIDWNQNNHKRNH